MTYAIVYLLIGGALLEIVNADEPATMLLDDIANERPDASQSEVWFAAYTFLIFAWLAWPLFLASILVDGDD